MSTPQLAMAYALVNVSNQNTGEYTIVTQSGIANVIIVQQGLFDITFADGLFKNYPSINVTQWFNSTNGFPSLNPICPGQGSFTQTTGGLPEDNAAGIWVAQNSSQTAYMCRFQTGGTTQNLYRSFSLMAIGPAGTLLTGTGSGEGYALVGVCTPDNNPKPQ